MSMQVGLSLAFLNRELVSGNKQDYAASFKTSTVTADELASHILEGRAWTPATFAKLRRKSDFMQAQIVALDCDDNVSVAKALDNLAIANYAAIIHATPSSTPDAPRSRIIFVLDSPVTDVDKWEQLQRALIYRFADLNPDAVAKDAARYFYGCKGAECHINISAALPVDALEKYVTEMVAEEEAAIQSQLQVAPGGNGSAPAIDRAVSYADATFRNSLLELQASAQGERNATLNKIAYGLFSKARSGEWPGITESTVQAELYQQGLSIGLEKAEVLATIRSAQNAARPQPLILTDKPLLSPGVNGGGLYVQTTNQVQQPLPVVPDIKIISHDDSFADYKNSLRVGVVQPGEILSFPMQAFHGLGGFCRYIPPGKLVGVIAPSSHGKTSMLETWIDIWLQMGISGVLFGPEWKSNEVWHRRAQRHAGIAYERMLEFEVYKSDLDRGIPQDKCRGRNLTESERNELNKFKERAGAWQGKLDYIDEPDKSLSYILAGLKTKLQGMRDSGQRVGYVMFDYAQILSVMPDEITTTNAYETALGMVKTFGEVNHVVPIVGSQVTKDASKAGRIIDGDNANWLRSDKFNLYISLNIMRQNPDDPDDNTLSNRAVANVAKNNIGRTGKVNLWTDFARLTWTEAEPVNPFAWGSKT